MRVERVDAALLRRNAQVAYLDLSTEDAVRRWGEPEVTWDDLGPWNTFAFRLADGTLAGLVREVENAPKPGYFLISDGDPAEVLPVFLSEADFDEARVLERYPG